MKLSNLATLGSSTPDLNQMRRRNNSWVVMWRKQGLLGSKIQLISCCRV